jgi:hypothetical protein
MSGNNEGNPLLYALGCLLVAPFIIIILPVIIPFIPVLILFGVTKLGMSLMEKSERK